jgi:multicomponent Na+:H+ antiporter subunit G
VNSDLLTIALDVASWIFLVLGGISVLIGGIGALRMPNIYSRMHAASVTDSVGAIFVIVGIMLQAGLSLATIKLAAILLFLLLTSPTASNALASAALLAGTRPDAAMPDEERAS